MVPPETAFLEDSVGQADDKPGATPPLRPRPLDIHSRRAEISWLPVGGKNKGGNTFKGRCVVKGWEQVAGVNCGGTFAPVCRVKIIRMVFGTAVEVDWYILELDVQTTLLNANVEEEVYVKIVPGYETEDR